MRPGRLSQHIASKHPLEWKGSIYETLPPDFDYGDGPLDPRARATLIKYAEYAHANYAKLRRKMARERQEGGPTRRPYTKRKSLSAMRRGHLGGTARAANARAKAGGFVFGQQEVNENGLVPRPDRPVRTVRYCPECGWNIEVCRKAQAFVDGRAE